MASIRKRGDLQWEARIRRKGQPVTCKTFNTKADAEKWARDVEGEMDKGVFVSRKEAESTTLKEGLERFIAEYIPQYKHADIREYAARALQRRKIATKFMASVRGKDIADYIRERENEGMSGNTIRLDLAMLSRLYNVAKASWGMESLVNPVQNVPRPKVNKGRTRRLEGDEEERLLEACNDQLRQIAKFAMATAMRRGEITAMDWRFVSLKKRSVYLPETKNSEERTVPLSPAAIAILNQLGGEGQEGLVFGMQPETLTRAFMRACDKAGIEDFTFHDLRHEATSRFFENTDLDVMEIKSITGHRSLQMLARYAHLRTHRLADRLAGAKRGEGAG
ncbi:tyrosine-type recombinase/integrase [Desulfovibrio sp. OttesenSCG-928-G11]|nr:tyrosine-type recombinase/integrase [Desulfovibrio sp. OttesenSCG-928-G11]